MRSEVPTGSLPIKEGGHLLDALRPLGYVSCGPRPLYRLAHPCGYPKVGTQCLGNAGWHARLTFFLLPP